MEFLIKVLNAKVRFDQFGKGVLTAEDLLTIKPELLNAVAIDLDAQIAKSGQQGYLGTTTTADDYLVLQRDIIVGILRYKLQLAADNKVNASKTAQRKQLEALIEAKKLESMASKSVEELMAELNAL